MANGPIRSDFRHLHLVFARGSGTRLWQGWRGRCGIDLPLPKASQPLEMRRKNPDFWPNLAVQVHDEPLDAVPAFGSVGGRPGRSRKTVHPRTPARRTARAHTMAAPVG